MLFKMAWRNLWRSKRRTIITLLSVAFGVWLAVTATGLGEYSYDTMIDTSARMGFGHLTVLPEEYLDAPKLDLLIGDAEAVEAELEAIPGIESAYVRITGQGMFATAKRSLGAAFFAVDPNDETADVNLFMRTIVEGKMFEKSQDRGIVIGSVMAEKLGVRLGKRVVFTLVDGKGELVSEVSRVKGIFETGVDDVDSSMVLLPIDTVRGTLGLEPGAGTMVSFFIDDHREADRFAEVVRTPDGASAFTWKETQPSIAGLVQVDRAMNRIMQLLLGILIAAGVLNTILMSVLERKREFGVMMAIGTTPGQLFKLVSIEAFFVGVVGTIVGAVLTAPWYWFLATVGIDFSEMMGEGVSSSGVLMDPIVHILLFPEHVAMIVVAILSLTMISGLYPAWQAGRDPPVETIKQV